jgi:hypothetical protein
MIHGNKTAKTDGLKGTGIKKRKKDREREEGNKEIHKFRLPQISMHQY